MDITVEFDKFWCPSHSKRTRSVAVLTVATKLLAEKAMEREEVQRLAGYNPDLKQAANPELLTEVFIGLGEMCCYMGDEATDEVLDEARRRVRQK